MNRSSLGPLGETEVEVLQHVWALGEATVHDVHERVLEEREVAYTTIMSVMKKLADKGYLTYEQQGRAFVYRPERPKGEVRHTLLSGLLHKVFHGSPAQLVETLIRYEEISNEEHERIRQMISQMERDDF